MEKEQFEKPSGLMLDMSDMPQLERAYNKAVEEKKAQFKFKGADVLTNYAKRVLEYAGTFRKQKHH